LNFGDGRVGFAMEYGALPPLWPDPALFAPEAEQKDEIFLERGEKLG
jgi:hypothetical protein